MSKNMTRKGLAFGAMVALGSTLFAGAPAQANIANVLLVPTAGTTFNSILGSNVTLRADLNANDNDTVNLAGNLVFRVENPDSRAITVNFDGRNAADNGSGDANQITVTRATAATSSSPISGTGNFSHRFVSANEDFSVAIAAAGSAEAIGSVAETSDKFIYVSGFSYTDCNEACNLSAQADTLTANVATANANSLNALTISTSEATRNVSLKVQAWLDVNGNGVVDSFEDASAVVDVIIYAPSNVSATTTIDYLKRSDDATKMSVVYNNNINPHFVAAKTFVRLFNNGSLVNVTESSPDTTDGYATDYMPAAVTSTTVAAGSGNTLGITRNRLTAGVNSSGVGNAFFFVAATPAVSDFPAGVYTAQAYYNTTGSTFVTVGAASISEDLTNGNNLLVDTLDAYVLNTANLAFTENTGALAVRTGTKAFEIKVQAEDSNVDLEASAIKFRATVEATVLKSGAVTVTGSQASLAEDDTTIGYAFSDSKGIATFNVTNSVGTKADVVTVVVEVLDKDGIWQAAETITATWADATLTTWSAAPGNYISGATPKVTFTARDQWSQPVSVDEDGKALSVNAVSSFGGIADATKFSRTVAVVNGVAEFSFTNFAPANGLAQLVATLKAGTVNATVPGGSAEIVVNVYNTAATDRIIVADTFSNAITYKDYVVGDTLNPVVAEAVAKAGYVAADYETINGSVLNANGVGQPGMAVVITGAGMMFKAGTVYAENTITAYTNEYGAFTVDVFTHTVATRGAKIEFAAGGKTASTLLRTYFPANLGGDNLKFTLTVPGVLVKNTTYAVTGKLEDKWGNPVATATTGSTTGMTVQAFGPLEVNATTNSVGSNFNASGLSTVYLRSVLNLTGKGSISASIGGALYSYWNEGTSAVATMALSDLGENLIDALGTKWDETSWTPVIGSEVEIIDSAPITGKVNVGSFNGKLVVYAAGLNGARISWKVGGNWGSAVATSNYSIFNRPTPRAGVTVSVQIYVNGVLTLTKSVLTR